MQLALSTSQTLTLRSGSGSSGADVQPLDELAKMHAAKLLSTVHYPFAWLLAAPRSSLANLWLVAALKLKLPPAGTLQMAMLLSMPFAPIAVNYYKVVRIQSPASRKKLLNIRSSPVRRPGY
jgi:hypothetical protein